MAGILLNDEQRRQLNDIYISIAKKYKNFSTESVVLDAPKRITFDEAKDLAELDLVAKRQKIEYDYSERVNSIIDNAIARNLMESTIVLDQLDKAHEKRMDSLDKLSNVKDKLAKKIFNDNQKLALSIEKEKATQRSKALRDMVAVKKMNLTVPFNAQTAFEDEIYNAYLAWLLQYVPTIAYQYVLGDRLFQDNLGVTKYNLLYAEMLRRVS